MFEILIFALIFFILFPVIRIVFALWKATRKFKKQFRDFQSSESGQSSSNNSQQRSRNGNYHSKKKIFDSNDGEYVEFEEVKVVRSSTSTSNQPDSAVNDSVENQITDVKFEEIK